MSARPMTVWGVFRNGVIVPDEAGGFCEGDRVALLPTSADEERAIAAEFAAWDAAGDEAWAMIDDWEREGTP